MAGERLRLTSPPSTAPRITGCAPSPGSLPVARRPRPACATSPSRKSTCSGSPGLQLAGLGDHAAVGPAGQAVAALQHRQRRQRLELAAQPSSAGAAAQPGPRGRPPAGAPAPGPPADRRCAAGGGPGTAAPPRPAAPSRRRRSAGAQGGAPARQPVVEHWRRWSTSRRGSPSRARARSSGRRQLRISPRTPAGQAPPQHLQLRSRSAATGTAISAAAEGVGARRSATKSAMVKSVSCPTAEITGTRQAAMARASPSSLKHHRSSSEPPPRARMTTSTSGTAATAPQRGDDRQRRPFALDRRGRQQDRHGNGGGPPGRCRG